VLTDGRRQIQLRFRFLPLAVAVALAGACSPDVESVIGTAAGARPVVAVNGLSPNGLSANGLSANGLGANGLSANGLSANGLSANGFATWFDANAPVADMVMGYVVNCAVPAGQTRTWTSPKTRLTYAWGGALGLLPGWAAGNPMTTAEEQVLTACLAAHVNKFGVHIPIAVEGRGATGVQIPIGKTELADYSVKEAAFFGNLVRDEGIFVCLDHGIWGARYSSGRACGFDSRYPEASLECPPVVNVGSCGSICTLDRSRTFYESCTWNGMTYKPLTTRLRQSDIYRCGDGTCQFTESCGNGTEYQECQSDCGLCP